MQRSNKGTHANRFWHRFTSFFRLKSPKELNGLHSAKQLRWIYEIESARADRTGSKFSFVLLDTGSSNNGIPQHIFQILRTRLRISDEAGWFDSRQIGVIMPDTTAQEAWKLAEDICQYVFENPRSAFCTVYTYPSDRLSKIFEDNALANPYKTKTPSDNNRKNKRKSL